ncbi:MAG: lipocalin family protein [Pseudomonadota bacterium]|nr:lipocalin family protein [Pseudomonadota bacterium]
MLRCLSLVLASFWISAALALTPVTGFDLKRYMGTWYEFAAIPGFLQSRCAGDTKTEYSAAENGAITNTTSCTRADGTADIRESRARPLEPTLPSVLKLTSVQFLGIWWYPFGRESIIISHDTNYRWVVSAHPSLRYGRILSREPTLSDEALRVIAAALREEGFDLCTFVLTPQAGGRDRPAKLCDVLR